MTGFLSRLVTKVCHVLTSTRTTTVDDDDEVAPRRNAGRTFKVVDQNLLTTKTMDDEDAPGLKALLVDNILISNFEGMMCIAQRCNFIIIDCHRPGCCEHMANLGNEPG
nr:hypothetical protein [Tanacetum cinerariifolium]